MTIGQGPDVRGQRSGARVMLLLQQLVGSGIVAAVDVVVVVVFVVGSGLERVFVGVELEASGSKALEREIVD